MDMVMAAAYRHNAQPKSRVKDRGFFYAVPLSMLKQSSRLRIQSVPAKTKSPLPSLTGACRHSTPPSCAMASTMSTPGMMGRLGKWPVNCGSLLVI